MEISNIFNLDLLSVGLAIASIGVLGFVVFFNNRRSVTNKTFLLLSLTIIFWSLINYFSYQTSVPEIALWVLRLVMFFAVWFVFFVMQLLFVFPKEKVQFPVLYKFGLVPLAVFTSVLTLTPLVFFKIAEVSTAGQVIKVVNGPGIFLFGVVVICFNVGGIVLLVRKMLLASGIERKQYRTVLVGILTTLFLITIFNFILPAFFDNPRFIPLGAVFVFPFVAFTAYAIFKHHLLNVKVITTEVLTFILAVVTFFEVVLSRDVGIIVFRSGIFILVLVFGILLIQSVRREVEQREKLEKLTKQLEAANIQLGELSRFKTQLLSLASHQIKAPLAAIKGFTTILLDGIYGPISDKVKETLAKVKKAADDLVALVNTLLDLRKIEEGRMEYDFKKAELNDLVKEVFVTLEPLAKSKKLEFTLTETAKFKVNCDPPKLQQVVQNLIDNAIKYTPEGFVRVDIYEEDSCVLTRVSDSGIGIPPNLLPYLFEEFIRDERVKKEIQGTGFGLYIARKMVEAHNGRIWAESDGPGKGSRFYVCLRKV